MSDMRKHDKVKSRNEPFVKKNATKIWKEVPSENNPYVAKKAFLHGYDILELAEKKSFSEVFFLMFKGELPEENDRLMLETLMILLISPGPRHPATRAAMNVGVGKTNVGHILPIASSLLSGDYLGGGEIEESMRFYRKNSNKNIQDIIESSPNFFDPDEKECFPGFGKIYGSIDPLVIDMMAKLRNFSSSGSALNFICELSSYTMPCGVGVLVQGLAAAILSDLGFQPRAGIAVFQLLQAPGLVAHGLELANKPITAMPYVSDEEYVIER